MPPRKNTRKFEYEERILQDDFLELLSGSREGKGANDFWKILTGEVFPRLKDQFDEVADTHIPLKGLQIFKWWYR